MVAPATILVGLAVCIASVLLVVVTAISVYLVIVHRRYSHIPSPKGASFFKGHFPQLQQASQKGKFFHIQLIEWSEEVGLLYVIWLIHMPLVVVLDQAGIKDVSARRVLKNRDMFDYLYGQRFVPRSLLAIADYEEWKKVRKPYDPLFTRSVLKTLVPQFNLIAKRFVDVTLKPQADGKTVVDFRDHYRMLAMEAISLVAFGGNFSEDPHVKLIISQRGSLLNLLDDVLLGFEKLQRNPMLKYMYISFGEYLQYAQSTRKVREIGEYVIMKRMQALVNKEEVPNDILTMILNSTQVEGKDLLEEMVDNFVVFFMAGQDTTANLLSFVTIMLNNYPEVLQRVMEEIEEVVGDKPDVEADDLEKLTYMTQVLEETLRLHPPSGGTRRESPDGMMLCGYDIPPGTAINIPIYSIHHLPLYYDDPLKFDPSRFAPGKQRPSPYVYLPFGLSHRMCIGRVFALIEAKVSLVHLLRAYSLHLTDDYVLQEELSITIHPRFGVPCTISPRHK